MPLHPGEWVPDHFIWSDKIGEVIKSLGEESTWPSGIMVVESLLILALNARSEDPTIYWWQDARWGPIYLVACESEDKILSGCGIEED